MGNKLRLVAPGLMAAAVIAFAAIAGPAASAGATRSVVVALGSIAASETPPRVVVDATGQGYVSWADGGAGAPLDYCRLPWGTTTCASRQSFAYAAGASQGTDAGNALVFTAGGQLALLDSRCCLTSNQKFLRLSSDGGKTFGAPVEIVSDHATGITGNLLDLPSGALFSGNPEQLLSSSTGPVTGGGSIQATGLAPAATDPGWFTPQVASGSLSESIGLSHSTLIAVYTQESTPHYTVSWVRYVGSGDPSAASSWSAPKPLSPAPSLDSNAQLASGPAGIFVARSIATPGDNERLVVQRFAGSGWSAPVAISDTAAGGRFAIDETPAGIVYVIWKDTDGALKYRIAKSRSATHFGAALTLPTTGDVEFPQIAVDAVGAGWATWTDGSSPAHAFAVRVPPPPKLTTVRLSDGGAVTLVTPRLCVAPGGHLTARIEFRPAKAKTRRFTGVARVSFSVGGSSTTVASHSPFRATLTLGDSTKPGSAPTVVAGVTIAARHGHSLTKSIQATITVCS
jgi:hypothetical protein